MPSSRCLRWSGAGISNGRQRLSIPCGQRRLFSINIPTTSPSRHLPAKRTRLLRHHPCPQQCRSISLFGWTPSKASSDEFVTAHTNPSSQPASNNTGQVSNASPPPSESPRTIRASHATSDAPEPSLNQSSPPYTPEPPLLHDLQNTIATPSSAPIPAIDLPGPTNPYAVPEYVGYLKETCGLDYGWGPTAMMEYIIEQLHISAGLTWGASILAIAFGARALLFRFGMQASDQAGRMRESKPLTDPLRKEMQMALARSDTQRVAQLRLEMRSVMQEYGVKMYKMFVPLLIQVPIGFGAFRLLRGMSTLPVPALEHESFLWLSDLSVGDPYWILPLASGFILYRTLKTGSPDGGDPAMLAAMPVVTVLLPTVTIAFMFFQPGALQIYFAATSLLAFGQAWLMKNPSTRQMLGLWPMPAPQAPQPPSMRPKPTASGSGTPIINSSGQIEISTAPRSAIDKYVDAAKERWGNVQAQASKTRDRMAGTPEERAKKTRSQQAQAYEVKRYKEMEMEKERRRMVAPTLTPGGGALRTPAQPVASARVDEDVFEDDQEIKPKPKRRLR